MGKKIVEDGLFPEKLKMKAIFLIQSEYDGAHAPWATHNTP